MQKINLIAQSVLELSHREKCGLQRLQRLQRRRLQRRHPSGLNYSPRRKVFRRGQKNGGLKGPHIFFNLSDCMLVLVYVVFCFHRLTIIV